MAMDAHKDMEAEIRARIEDMHEKVPNYCWMYHCMMVKIELCV